MAAARTKDTYLAAQYARLVGRRGKARARKAVGHSILAAFHILAGGVPYAELGGDYYLKRNSPERRARKNLHDLQALGWNVTETPDGVICQPREGCLTQLHSHLSTARLNPEPVPPAAPLSPHRSFHPSLRLHHDFGGYQAVRPTGPNLWHARGEPTRVVFAVAPYGRMS